MSIEGQKKGAIIIYKMKRKGPRGHLWPPLFSFKGTLVNGFCKLGPLISSSFVFLFK